MKRFCQAIIFAMFSVLASPRGVAAQQPTAERLCDTQFEDCRTPLLELIRNEQIGIDVAFWYMQDSRYVTELVNRFRAGVPVRILLDERANKSYPLNATMLGSLRDAGIPMRQKLGGDVLHFKMMLFHGQNIVEFSKANFDPFAFVPTAPNNYDDEAIFFTNDDNLTNSFRRRFDDRWIDVVDFRDYANITAPLARTYPLFPIHPSMNFVPLEDFSDRAVSRYDRETQSMDAIVFRVTDHRQADAVIRAVARRVPVRIITDPGEYRNPARVWDSKHVDRMFMGGAQIKMRQHQGVMHEAAVVLHGLGEVIFGSANWTTASAFYQDEHNYFYDPSLAKPWFFKWFADQFTKKWNDTANYVPFVPLPPDAPVYSAPTDGTSGLPSSVTLRWDGGPWSHLYDVYFGITANPPLVAGNMEIGSPLAGEIETYTVSNLRPGTTYYWRIVDRTWAQLMTSGPTWSFTTEPLPPGEPAPFGGTPAAIPGTIEAENFDEGGQDISYSDTTPGNTGGVYRSSDVDVQATTDTGGGYNVGWTKTGEWLKYTVNVAATGSYQLETRVGNIGTGATFHLEVDGVDRTGPIAVPDTTAWQMWQTVTTTGIQLTAGPRVIRIVFDAMTARASVGNFNWLRFSVAGAPPPPPPPTNTPYGGTPVSLPGIVQAENFDNGGESLAYHDTSAGNAGAAYRSTDVDIAPSSDPSSGGFYVGWAREGEWLKYTVDVTQTRNYTVSVRVANLGAGATFRLEVDGVDLTGPVSVPNTGSWDVFQTIPLPNLALTQGQHVLRLVMLARNVENNGVGNYGYMSFD